MKRFLLAFSLNHPVEFSDSFALLCVSKSQVSGSVRETIDRSSMGIHFPKQYQHCVLASSDKTVLQELISKIHHCPSLEVTINSVACKYNVNGQSFSTVQSSSCVALVSWDVDLFGQPQISSSVPLAESDSFARPIRINSFLIVQVVNPRPMYLLVYHGTVLILVTLVLENLFNYGVVVFLKCVLFPLSFL